MAASEMGFSRSGHPGTRRSRPTHSGEPPKARCVASARTSSGSIRVLRWMPPPSVATDLLTYERPEHGHHARAERAGRDWAGLGVT